MVRTSYKDGKVSRGEMKRSPCLVLANFLCFQTDRIGNRVVSDNTQNENVVTDELKDYLEWLSATKKTDTKGTK